MYEKELKYRELIYGHDDDAALMALDMLDSEKEELNVPVALGFVDVEGDGSIKDFKMCAYLTTQRLWEWIMGSNPSYNKVEGMGLNPVEQVSYNDIQEFLKKLNGKFPGYGFALPTDKEWLYAAKGGKESKGYKYPGSDDLEEVAWYADNSGGHSHPTGELKPNEIGLYDMCGDLFEFVEKGE